MKGNKDNTDKIKLKEENIHEELEKYMLSIGDKMANISDFSLFLGVSRQYFSMSADDSAFNRKTDPLPKSLRGYLDQVFMQHNFSIAQDKPALQRMNMFLLKVIHNISDKQEIKQDTNVNHNITRVVDGLADED